MLEENLIDGLLVDTYNRVYPMRYVLSVYLPIYSYVFI